MGEKEPFDRAVENHHLHARIKFEQFDDLFQLRNCLGPEDIQGRMVKCYSPIRWRKPLKPNLSRVCWLGHFFMSFQ